MRPRLKLLVVHSETDVEGQPKTDEEHSEDDEEAQKELPRSAEELLQHLRVRKERDILDNLEPDHDHVKRIEGSGVEHVLRITLEIRIHPVVLALLNADAHTVRFVPRDDSKVEVNQQDDQ